MKPLFLVLILAFTGCDSILSSDQAAFAFEARVLLDGTTPVPLFLIASTSFTATRDLDTGDLVASNVAGDTIRIDNLPFDRTFDIRGADRFLVRLTNPDLNQTATIQLRVRLDGDEVFNQHATMRDATLTYIAYYAF